MKKSKYSPDGPYPGQLDRLAARLKDYNPQEEKGSTDTIADVELAKVLGITLSGHVSEWPQLRPLLIRLAKRIEDQEKKINGLSSTIKAFKK